MGSTVWSMLSGYERGRWGMPRHCWGQSCMLKDRAEGLLGKWAPGRGCLGGRGSHLQFSTRYCMTLSSTFSMSAVRTHMCFKACRLSAGAFPPAEPCLRRASWLPAEGFLQRDRGLQKWKVWGGSPRQAALGAEFGATRTQRGDEDEELTWGLVSKRSQPPP